MRTLFGALPKPQSFRHRGLLALFTRGQRIALTQCAATKHLFYPPPCTSCNSTQFQTLRRPWVHIIPRRTPRESPHRSHNRPSAFLVGSVSCEPSRESVGWICEGEFHVFFRSQPSCGVRKGRIPAIPLVHIPPALPPPRHGPQVLCKG